MGDSSEEVAITISVPVHHIGSLKELLREFPRLHYVASGWIVRTVAIIGPPHDMAQFRPRLAAWQLDCESGDAL